MTTGSTIPCDTNFLNNLPEAIILIDQNEHTRFTNEHFIHLTGYTLTDIQSIELLREIIFPDEKQRKIFKEFWADIQNSSLGRTKYMKRRCIISCKNKTKKEIEISGGKFNDQFLGLYLSEISRAHKGKKPVLQDENPDNYYKQIVDLANVAIIKFDRSLILTDFAGDSEHIFGFRKFEVIGKNLYDTIVPEVESTGRDLKKMIEDVMYQTKNHEYNVNENIRKDGKRIWMQWYNTEIRGNKNELLGILSIGIDISDRINAELALKESEHRFKMLSNLTFEGILIHDKGIIQDCNLSLQKQIGYTREELIGMNIFEKIIPRDYHESIRKTFKQKSASYEAEAIHKNGTHIPISIESRDAKIGNDCLRVVAIRDISELKRTIGELNEYKSNLENIVTERTKELKHQNETLEFERNQLRTIIDNLPDLIYIKDRESKFLNVNKKLIQHFGKKNLNEVIGKTDHDYYPEEYANKYRSDEKNILKTGSGMINKEEPCINSKGEKIFLSTTKVPLKDMSGNIVSIVGIGKDVTYKKQAEMKLKFQAENLKEVNTLLEEKTIFIEELNRELNISNKNLESANKILQDRKEELETALEQLKSAQTQLIHSEKMASLGVLTAGIAHEINNPVNFIYAGVTSVMKDFEDIKMVCDQVNQLNKKTKDVISLVNNIIDLKNKYEFSIAFQAIEETLKDIKLGATRISEIVRGLSRFTRMETEHWKKTNLHEELENVLILLKNRYKNRINIKRNYYKNLPHADCYPGKINQVFMNMINNAIDAIGDYKGTITIKTDCTPNKALISIKDSGTGIKEENKLKIFDPFFTTKDVGFGMGLGLAISYTIIKEHNGDIKVNSKPGKGTEMIITIPLVQQ